MKNANMLTFSIGILFLFSFATSAQISGTTYDWIEETPLDFTIIKAYFEENLVGQTVSDKNGFYSLSLAKGQYTIKAEHTQNNTKYYTDENITVLENDLILDLLLMEEIPEMFALEDLPEEIFSETYTTGSIELEEEPTITTTLITKPSENWTLQIATTLILLLVALFLITKKQLFNKKQKTNSIELSEDTVLSIIKEKNQCLQSDIVEKTGFSEAKVSLIIKSLIEQNKIQKQKIGRNNVLSPKK